MEDFQEWLDSLELQTLTDELKSDILERVKDVYDDGYNEGYGEAKHDVINHLTYNM